MAEQRPEVSEDGGIPARIHLPSPSIWPVVLAGGITLLLFGVVTSLVFSVVGALLTIWALAGWIGELRHE